MDDTQIFVRNEKGQKIELTLLTVKEAKRMLGVYLAANGENITQIEHLRDVAENWKEKIRVGHLIHNDAWTALTTTVMKSLEYPLLATTLTEQECSYIMAPILEGGLPLSGICRNFSRAVVYGPIKHLGLGLHNLYTTQGIRQIQAILNHVWRKTDTGKLIQITLEYAKLEIGMTGSFLSLDFELFSHLCEETWIKHVWKFMREKGITIEDDLGDFPMQRQNDKPITQSFAEAFHNKLITKREWRRANLCRKYLRVVTISDITSANGKVITQQIWKGKRKTNHIRQLPWCSQGKPSRIDWGIWRRVLKRSICNKDRVLHQPLGNWFQSTYKKIQDRWDWFWDDSKSLLYRKENEIWYKYSPLAEGRRTRRGGGNEFRFYYQVQVPINWRQFSLTTIVLQKNILRMEGSSPREIINLDTDPDMVPNKEGLVQYLTSRKGEEWVTRGIGMTTKIDDIVNCIREGTAVGVSDGSFKEEYGTAAWVLENKTGTQRIMGHLVSPGFNSDQSAYRSEISGLYAMVMMTEAIIKVWNIQEGGITLGCDGKSALRQALSIQDVTIKSGQQSHDLLSGIHGYINDSKIEYVGRHIKGHQDEKIKAAFLDKWAQLNIEMDFGAKDWWIRCHPTQSYFNYTIPKGMWQIKLLGNRISNKLQGYLRDSIEGGVIADYWVNQKQRFTEQNYFKVDWEAVGKAMKSVSKTRRRWISKFETGMCATGHMMVKWKKRLIPNCPRCNFHTETIAHILQCPSETALLKWEMSIKSIKDWLQGKKTCPELQNLIISSLQSWHLNIKPILPKKGFLGVDEIYLEQQSIGWRQFIGGCISKKWAIAQNKYYFWIGSKKSGNMWAKGLIQQLWKVAWNQWEDRNHALHKTTLAQDMEGAISLDTSIKAELELGYETLPKFVKKTFPRLLSDLLAQPIQKKKFWFVLVRKHRELKGTAIQDAFTSANSQLRKWVGL